MNHLENHALVTDIMNSLLEKLPEIPAHIWTAGELASLNVEDLIITAEDTLTQWKDYPNKIVLEELIARFKHLVGVITFPRNSHAS